jgi:DNA integrity scanning protein DisA with diadenylate cyclase activity
MSPEELRLWADAVRDDSVQPRLVVAENVRAAADAWEGQVEALEKENRALRIMYNEATGDGDLEIDAMVKDYVAALAAEKEDEDE